MKIAYFSPLPPARTGIADYSATLLPLLARHADIDLWIDDTESNGWLANNFRRFNYVTDRRLEQLLSTYDVRLYHLGNSPAHRHMYATFLRYPGVVVLHDFVLHHFLAGYYLDWIKSPESYVTEMEYNYGKQGRALGEAVLNANGARPWESAPLQYPLNKRVLDTAQAIIVHSSFARNQILATHPQAPIRTINLCSPKLDNTNDRVDLRSRYGIPLDVRVIASFGLATAAKRIDTILSALAGLSRADVMFLIVGDVAPDVAALLSTPNAVAVRSTGYVDPAAFDDYIRIADICVNLRWPTMGETSASVCRIMGASKPCLVSDVGWFAELPNDCVAKVPVDDTEKDVLAVYLGALLENPALRTAIGANAQRYVRANCDTTVIAEHYAAFLLESLGSDSRRQFAHKHIKSLSDALVRIGVNDRDDSIMEEVARRLAYVLGRT